MNKLTVGNVIGAPETWPNFRKAHNNERRDLREAVITSISESEDGIAVSTTGSRSGDTYAVFAIADPWLRARVLEVLRVGQTTASAVQLTV